MSRSGRKFDEEDEFGRSKTNTSRSSASRKRFEEFRSSNSAKPSDEGKRGSSSRGMSGEKENREEGDGRRGSRRRFEEFRSRNKNKHAREDNSEWREQDPGSDYERDRGRRSDGDRDHDRYKYSDDEWDDDDGGNDRRRNNRRDRERQSRRRDRGRSSGDSRRTKRSTSREREDSFDNRERHERHRYDGGNRRSLEHGYKHHEEYDRGDGQGQRHRDNPNRRDDNYDDRYDFYARGDSDYHHDRNHHRHEGPTHETAPTFERGDIIEGSVSRIEPYGAFVTILSRKDKHNDKRWKSINTGGGRALSALAHISQISHLSRIDTPADVLTIGQKVCAVILECYFEEFENTNRRSYNGARRHREKISISISGVDQDTKEQRGASEWTMPPPRPKRHERDQEYGYDAVGGGGGEQMFSNYMNGRGGSNGGGRNKADHLLNRAKDRMKMRRLQDGDNTWRGSDIGRDTTSEHRNAPHIDLSLVWGRSPSPPAEKARDRKVPSSSSRSRSSSSESDSSSSASSRSMSSSGSSSSPSNSSSGDSMSRRRSRKNRSRRARSKRNNRRKRGRSYSSSSESSSSSDSDSDSSDTNVSHKRKERKRSNIDERSDEHIGKRIKVSTDEASEKDGDDKHDPKENAISLADDEELREAREFKKAVQGVANSDSEDDDMGPMPLVNPDATAGATGGGNSSKAYGGALLPGEGEALAAYVQQNLRIPRRGEIGYDADEIDKYEASGFVMSGSRHARMNAVRIRKENQVYSAEEQRALALITLEENQQKEAALLNDFRTMLKEKQEKLSSQNGK